MNAIKPLAETTETVTLTRRDYEALLNAKEDAIDNAALDSQEQQEAALGVAAARADYLPAAAVGRLLAGEHPLRIWREHRGLGLRAMAAQAGVSVSYLSEVERGRKPGSAALLLVAARTLRVPMESLLPSQEG